MSSEHCVSCKLSPAYSLYTLNLKILSRANSLIANNNIRSVILEIKNGRCKIVKMLIFPSLSREHFQSKWERNSILTILHLSFLIPNMTLLILLLFAKKQIRISKCYLVRLQAPKTQLNSLFVLFSNSAMTLL